MNQAASTPGQLVGKSVYDVYRDEPARLTQFTRTLAGHTHTLTEEVGGAVFDTRWAPVQDEKGTPSGAIILGSDVTERRRAEDALRHQALHDGLTGLPNRALLHDRLEVGLSAAERTGTVLTCLLVDLNRFKEINDTLGHECGDQVIQQVGARLAGSVRGSDTVARLGGDEFAVVLPGTGAQAAWAIARKMVAAIEEPLIIDGQSLTVGGSVGIAVGPDHGSTVALLLRRADRAMYVAKGQGGGVCLSTAGDDEETVVCGNLVR